MEKNLEKLEKRRIEYSQEIKEKYNHNGDSDTRITQEEEEYRNRMSVEFEELKKRLQL